MLTSLFISIKKTKLPLICGVLLTALCILNPLFSQEATESDNSEEAQHGLEKRGVLTVSTGIAHNVLGDYFNTGKNESSLAGTLRIGYDKIGLLAYHTISLETGFSYNRFTTPNADFLFPDGESKYQTFQIFYGSYFNVLPLNIFNLYVGYHLDQALEIWHIPNSGSYDWIASLNLGPGVVVMLDWAKHSFRANYSLPLFGSLSRSVHTANPYRLFENQSTQATGSLFDEKFFLSLIEGTRFFSWKNVVMSSLALDYEWRFIARVGLFARYDFSVATFSPVDNFPRITNFTHKFNIGLSLSF